MGTMLQVKLIQHTGIPFLIKDETFIKKTVLESFNFNEKSLLDKKLECFFLRNKKIEYVHKIWHQSLHFTNNNYAHIQNIQLGTNTHNTSFKPPS